MTAGESVSFGCYPEAEGFTDDEAFAVFCSNRTGAFQLYRADVETGELGQLSEVEDFEPESFAMAPNGHEAMFVAGWRVHAIDVETGEERVMIDTEGKIPSPPSGATVALSASGDRMTFIKGPSTVDPILYLAELEGGEVRELHRWPITRYEGDGIPAEIQLNR